MIVKITREGKEYGSIVCSLSTNDHGEVDTEVWFCPHCGRIYAREDIQFEQNERKVPLLYHVLSRPCYLPLHELSIPHPTFWICSDERLLRSALEEYFNERNPNSCPALSAA